MPDIEVPRHLLQPLGNLVGRADDDIAALDDRLHLGRRARLLAGGKAGGAADLALDAGALRRLGDIAGWHRPARIDAQAAAVEILGRLAIEPKRLRPALGNPDKLQKAGAIAVALLAKPRHLGPEPVHRRLTVLVAEIGQVGVDVVHGRAPLPSL